MKIEDIENSVPLTEDKVNDNEDHNNEKLKAKKKSGQQRPKTCKHERWPTPNVRVGETASDLIGRNCL